MNRQFSGMAVLFLVVLSVAVLASCGSDGGTEECPAGTVRIGDECVSPDASDATGGDVAVPDTGTGEVTPPDDVGGDDAVTPDRVALPFAVDDWYVPSGFMGDGETPGNLDADAGCPTRPDGALGDCHGFVYTPSGLAWAGVYWQYPEGNWGTEPGLPIAAGATRVTFTAWGAAGGEEVTFLAGIGDADGFAAEVGPVTLTTTPTEYAILLVGETYDEVAGGFGWSAAAPTGGGPLTFYVDDIQWTDAPIDGVLGCTDDDATNYAPDATTDDGSCLYEVTFQVDLSDEELVAGDVVTLEGTFNNWCNGCAPMADADEDGVWTLVVPLESGTYEYKYTINGFEGVVETVPAACDVVPDPAFDNRGVTVVDAPLVIPAHPFGACSYGGDVEGCTDPTADNYDPTATVDDGSCTYTGLSQVDLPITFDDPTVNYTVVDFGGTATTLVPDPTVGPTDAANTVASTLKTDSAETWAGTTASTDDGLATAIPLAAGATRMSVRVYSPDAGIPVRLKVEDHTDPTHSVETEALTTVADTWETLTFDFANPAAGTAAWDPGYTYDKLSIFFNFGTDGATAGAKTYLWDDVQMAAGGGDVEGCTDPTADNYNPAATVDDGSCTYTSLSQVDLPITFDDPTVDYTVTDFGGTATTLVADPTDAANTVASTLKTDSAETWAGTTASTDAGLATAIPLAAGATRMSVRVYSPDAGVPVRVKVEDHADPTHSVETEATTTVADAWETLTFDFANQAAGTAAIDFGYTYDKLSIFFNFGTNGATAGAKTYLWDDVQMAPGGGDVEGCTDPTADNYNPAATVDDGSCTYTGLSQVDLPITFDDPTVDYTVTDFGGTATTLVADPTDGGNMVASTLKSDTAETWAGTTASTDAGLATAIPLAAGATRMSVRVYSPDAGVPVRVKVEDHADPTHSVETEATTTVADAWETLTFDFANQAAGTAAIDFGYTYDKLSIFFNFGTNGATAGAKTYLWDDVQMAAGGGDVEGCTDPTADNYNPAATVDDGSCTYTGLSQVDLPITFDDPTVDYTVTDFGGTATTLVADPTDGGNMVASTLKSDTAETWAGTTASTDAGLATAIPLAAGATRMSVRVYSPDAGVPVRVKVEDHADPTHSVETEATTTVADAWETLTFDFANQAAGTAAIDFGYTYDKLSIFFNFGTNGATAGAKTYLWDDVQMAPGGGDVEGCTDPTADNYNPAATVDDGSCTYTGLSQVDLPITFDDPTVDYTVTDFGGTATTLVADPTDGGNMVASTLKSDTAELWAGTTASTDAGLATAIPLAAGATRMSVRVYSPDAGIPVRLKVEDHTDPTHSVETEATTTVADAWETLTFDFANQAAGTAAIDFGYTYDKLSIFFNFGTDGATAGAKTYLWDDVQMAPGGGDVEGCTDPTADNYNPAATVDDGSCTYTGLSQVDLPITFDDPTVDYTVTDFGGTATTLVADPTDGGNMVASTLKSDTAETWAGTTASTDAGLATAIPLAAGATRMSVRVYSPDAGIPVRLKVEDHTDPTHSVETEATTTVADAWETLTFDFANQAAGTAAIDFGYTYDKLSIFFNFGTNGATAGAKTYLWDDVQTAP